MNIALNTIHFLLLLFLLMFCWVVKYLVRGCLHLKLHPEINLVPGWHPPDELISVPVIGMNPSLSKRQGWNFVQVWKKEKQTCNHFITWWNFTKGMLLLNFSRMYLICFSTLTCLNIMKVTKKYYRAFLLKVKPEKLFNLFINLFI